MMHETNHPPEKERQNSYPYSETIQNLLDPILKVYIEVGLHAESKTIFEVAVTFENLTAFSLLELRLEAGNSPVAHLVSLPFFEPVRQLGRLEARQKSARQLFRYRWEPAAGPLEQAIIEFRLSGQPDDPGAPALSLVILSGLASGASREHLFKLTLKPGLE